MAGGEFSILGFGEFLAAFAIGVHEAREHALEEAAKIIEKEAKRVIGTYDYDWPQLADATQTDRANKGFPPNEPLLRTGELRDSIEHTVHAEDGEADIGSDSDIAVYQELGTAGGGWGGPIPPRPFLAGAAAHKTDEVVEEMGKALVEEVLEGRAIARVLPR